MRESQQYTKTTGMLSFLLLLFSFLCSYFHKVHNFPNPRLLLLWYLLLPHCLLLQLLPTNSTMAPLFLPSTMTYQNLIHLLMQLQEEKSADMQECEVPFQASLAIVWAAAGAFEINCHEEGQSCVFVVLQPDKHMNERKSFCSASPASGAV